MCRELNVSPKTLAKAMRLDVEGIVSQNIGKYYASLETISDFPLVLTLSGEIRLG